MGKMLHFTVSFAAFIRFINARHLLFLDLKTIETRLKNKIYKSFAELNYDMNKIFDNCLIYNGRTSHYSHYAETLKENFNELVDEFRENDR